MDHSPHGSLVEPPPRAPYKFSNLLRLPQRLLRSPLRSSPPEPTLSPRTLSLLSHRSSSRRSQHIKLEHLRVVDLYEGTLPPVSLRDFEYYLVYSERSVENLYFDVWLRSYSTLFHSIAHAHPSHRDTLRATLTAAYNLGLASFLHEDSLLELNITSETRRELDSAIGSLLFTPLADGTHATYLPPDAFNALQEEIETLLANSFAAFIRHQRGNGGRKRGYFALAVGALSYLIGFVPMLVAMLLTQARGWRVSQLCLQHLSLPRDRNADGFPLLFAGLRSAVLLPWHPRPVRRTKKRTSCFPPVLCRAEVPTDFELMLSHTDLSRHLPHRR